MLSWLLVIYIGLQPTLVTVPGVLSKGECDALAVKIVAATRLPGVPTCIPYYRTP